jgi:hypothetical protein
MHLIAIPVSAQSLEEVPIRELGLEGPSHRIAKTADALGNNSSALSPVELDAFVLQHPMVAKVNPEAVESVRTRLDVIGRSPYVSAASALRALSAMTNLHASGRGWAPYWAAMVTDYGNVGAALGRALTSIAQTMDDEGSRAAIEAVAAELRSFPSPTGWTEKNLASAEKYLQIATDVAARIRKAGEQLATVADAIAPGHVRARTLGEALGGVAGVMTREGTGVQDYWKARTAYQIAFAHNVARAVEGLADQLSSTKREVLMGVRDQLRKHTLSDEEAETRTVDYWMEGHNRVFDDLRAQAAILRAL